MKHRTSSVLIFLRKPISVVTMLMHGVALGARPAILEDAAPVSASSFALVPVNPTEAESFRNRGIAYQAIGDHAKAISDFDKAIRLDPSDSANYYYRGLSHHLQRDYQKAIADYDEAIRLNPTYALAFTNRCNAYKLVGDHAKAMADCDEAVRLAPTDPTNYYYRGIAYRGTRDYAKAIANYDEAIRLDPTRADYIGGRGDTYTDMGDDAKAIVDYEKAARLDPKNVEYLNNLAWLLGTSAQESLRDGKKAVLYATRACEVSKWKIPSTVDTLAAAYAEAGDLEQAIMWEKKFLAISNLTKAQAREAKKRLRLFQSRKPYHRSK